MENGLLGFLDSPAGAGLLSAVVGGLAGARRGTPVNNVGRAGLAGLAGYSQANEDIYQKDQLSRANELRDIQIAEAKRVQGLNSQLGGLFDKYKTPGTPETPERTVFNDPLAISAFNARPVSSLEQPQQQRDFSTTTIPGVPAKPAGINFDALNQEAEPLLAQLDPKGYFQNKTEQLRKQKEIKTYKPGDILGDQAGNIIKQFPLENKDPSSIQEYNFAVNQGYKGTFKDFKESGSRAGASNTNVRIDNKTGESFAKEIGPIAESSYNRANAAVEKVRQGDRVLDALDTGKTITGTGAGIRIDALRLANTLGVGGANDQEKLANTQQVIKGLAGITLEARQKLKGSGEITDNETELLARAESGDINLSEAELRRIVEINRSAAQIDYGNHQRLLGTMQGRPEGQLAPYFTPQPLPEARKKAGAGATQAKPKFGEVRGGYSFKGGDPSDQKNWVKR